MTTIVTHNAKFHADDVFAVASLFLLLGEENCQVIRTRDHERIVKGDYVVDVGEEYSPEERRFDHHQKGGAADRENGIPYASFGLVWKEYGEKIAGSKRIAEVIEQRLTQPIDAGDNGVETYRSTIDGIFPFTINGIVDSYRSTWKEEENWDERFLDCVHWAVSVLARQIKIVGDWEEGAAIISNIYEKSKDKRIIIIGEEHNFGRELVTSALSKFPEPIYAAYHRGDATAWQVLAIRKDDTAFEVRKPFPESWGAKRDLDLEEVTGVKGAIFCHRARFMCMADSCESACALAEIALNS